MLRCVSSSGIGAAAACHHRASAVAPAPSPGKGSMGCVSSRRLLHRQDQRVSPRPSARRTCSRRPRPAPADGTNRPRCAMVWARMACVVGATRSRCASEQRPRARWSGRARSFTAMPARGEGRRRTSAAARRGDQRLQVVEAGPPGRAPRAPPAAPPAVPPASSPSAGVRSPRAPVLPGEQQRARRPGRGSRA